MCIDLPCIGFGSLSEPRKVWKELVFSHWLSAKETNKNIEMFGKIIRTSMAKLIL